MFKDWFKKHGERRIVSLRIMVFAGAIMLPTIFLGYLAIRTAETERLVVWEKLKETGTQVEQVAEDAVRIRGGAIQPTDIVTFSYPGFPTDAQAPMVALLSAANGISIVTDTIYPDRFMHIAELNRLGGKHGIGRIECRGVRRAGFRVLVGHSRPAVLIECGYLTNRTEARRLSTTTYQSRIAEAIVDGIADHFNR